MVFKKIIFQNSLMANETPSRPPPFMANAILNFHFDFLNPSLIYKAKMWSAGSRWCRSDPGSEHLHRDRRHHSPCSPLLSLLLCQVNLTIIILFSLGFFINLIKCSKDAFAEKMFHLFSITLTFLFTIDVKLKMLRLQKRGRCRNWPCQKWRGDCC